MQINVLLLKILKDTEMSKAPRSHIEARDPDCADHLQTAPEHQYLFETNPHCQ